MFGAHASRFYLYVLAGIVAGVIGVAVMLEVDRD